VHRIGSGPVLQYRPLKPIASGACSDRARSWPPIAKLTSPPIAATCLPASTRHTCSCHPCAAPLAGARTLTPRAWQLRGHPPPHSRCCRPVATSVPRAAHAATSRAPYPSPSVRRRSRSLLSPQLPSSSRHSTRARHHHCSLATVDRRLWCSSGPIHPTRSVTWAQKCSPTSPTEPATAGRPPHRRTPPPDRHRRREPATVSLLPPFAPNQDHRRPGLLPGRFPADQRLPAGRIRPVSHRRRRGIYLPCFLSWAETPEGTGPLDRAGRALLWAEPKCKVHFLNYLSISFDLIQIKFKSILNLIKLSEFCFQP
jgi:hypothetical protein